MDGKSLNILHDQLEKLKQFFPEAVTESKIDWEKLQATLGKENIEFLNERYVLNWAGKSDAFKILQQTTTATLKPIKEESINFDTTENIFIEGENLEVLKVLQKAYYGKVKVICIDPPYNTGNDSFIYPDSFKERKEDYQKRIGDVDEEGYLLKEGYFRKNSKDSGHYHSNWLSMMYPRLFLAKNLLRDDGVIFVHIDDNEVHNLRLIMNEIFGEENLLAELVWDLGTGTAAGHFTRAHEYVLCYSKSKDGLENFSYNGVHDTISERAVKKISKGNPASQIHFTPGIEFKGMDAIFRNQLGKKEVIKIIEGEMVFENGKLVKPVTLEAGWAMRNQILSWLEGKETFDSKGQKVLKFFFDKKGVLQYEKQRGFINPQSLLRNIASTRKGSTEIEELFGKNIMDFPKPVQLIKYLINIVTEKHSDIVLDFFAGSATAAQAVLEQNKEDGGNRKFILVQLPEKCEEESEAYKAGYKTIADIGKERIRRVIKKLNEECHAERSEASKRVGLFHTDSSPDSRRDQNDKLDLGFKVFKLSSSNFKIWRGNEITEENLETQLDAFTNPVKEGSEKENMLYELMLKAGYLLTDRVECKNKLYYVNGSELIIALEEMNQKLVDTIISVKPKKVITLDRLFADNDQLKTNTVLQMRDAEIDFKTI